MRGRARAFVGAVLLLSAATPGCARPPDRLAEENKEVVRQMVAAINARDFDRLEDLVAPDVVRHSPSTPGIAVRSLEEFQAFLRQDLASIPDSRQEIRMILAEGDRVAVWANYSGTQEGPMGPYPATGKPVDLDFAGILRLEEGRIAEMWVVWDNVSMLAQLGHLAMPGP